MRFILTIECDNDAFAPEPGPELARLLRATATEIDGGFHQGCVNLLDINGNTVGQFMLEEDPPDEIVQAARAAYPPFPSDWAGR